MVLLGLTVLLASCGGGGDSTTTPGDIFNPIDQAPAGDDNEPILPLFGNFQLPGGASYADVRGIAASNEYVYVVDSANIYCFDKLGNFVNFAPVGAEVRGVSVFPAAPQIELSSEDPYPYANLPIVAHQPISQWGYLTIFTRTLNPGAARPDSGNADLGKVAGLPNAEIIPPAVLDDTQCLNVYDVGVDRMGSVYVTADIDVIATEPIPDYPRALQVLNFFRQFALESGGEWSVEDPQNQDQVITGGSECFHRADGFFAGDFGDLIGPGGVGSLGTFVMDTYFPFNRTEMSWNVYSGAADFERNYIGVGRAFYNDANLTYTVSGFVENGLGYNRVIGDSYGGGPSQFAELPPTNGGQLEDPDLNVGGPAGMAVDWRTDDLYVCDPGNRRVQIFDGNTGEFTTQIGSGARGSAGNNFIAPSDVAVDLEGNIFIADVDQLRIIRPGGPADRKYGGVNGTVKNLNTQDALASATVTIGNESGVLAARTTDINGQYVITNLLTGQYFMQCTKFNFDSDSSTVEILPEQNIVVNFNLIPNAPATLGSYGGTVIAEDTSLYIEDVKVTVANTTRSTTSDSIGSFFIGDLPAGTYQVVFSHPEFQTLTKTIDIATGQNKFDTAIKMVPIS
ncbi:MAG: carboxypeptidase regulatory-like domain-containing protein [bacterium]